MVSLASIITDIWVAHISIGSCSTQPLFGKCWVNSFCFTEHILPSLSNIIALELVVP